jgi:hypothetical protein
MLVSAEAGAAKPTPSPARRQHIAIGLVIAATLSSCTAVLAVIATSPKVRSHLPHAAMKDLNCDGMVNSFVIQPPAVGVTQCCRLRLEEEIANGSLK